MVHIMITAAGSSHLNHDMLVVNHVGEDGHDDGLVHAHEWASADSGMPSGGYDSAPAAVLVVNRVGDDGLVHSHNWAAGA